jgi:ATP-dependent RNA helicase DeaD
MKNFSDLELSPLLIQSLAKLLITTPTPIQQKAIPPALNHKDILASAQTGTGKTVAYLAPLLVNLSKLEKGMALILVPTRELAAQVDQNLRKILDSAFPFKTALLIGGASMSQQLQQLRQKPRIVVGTPGRVNDHIERGSLNLKEGRFLILDEADRMLDMGFGPQIDRIVQTFPKERQTFMFSATLPPNIEKLSRKYLNNPHRISIDSSLQPDPKIKQEILRTKSVEKQVELAKQLKIRQGLTIIFVRTRRRAEKLARELKKIGHTVEEMHGNLTQKRRASAVHAFRTSKSRIMVATDVAARGLDIPHVMHVINYDLPDCAEDYIHRIGRTGRANAEGNALSIISPEENHKWKAIARLLDRR